MSRDSVPLIPDPWDIIPVPEPQSLAEMDAETDRLIDRDLLGPEGANLQPMGVGEAVSGEHIERFAPVLPRSIIHTWQRFGFEGFSGGAFWITDPLKWAPVVQDWLDPVMERLPFTDTWHCLARNAMGTMFLWGENTGDTLEIDPVYHEVIVDQLARRTFTQPGAPQRAGDMFFGSMAYLPDDEGGRPLPSQALERLGPLGVDEVYGFVLPVVLGGSLSVDNLRIVNAFTYLSLQAQQDEIAISDPVGGAWEQIAPIIGAEPTTGP
ncbi:GAD-like domain [Actinomyces bovis]|uniref:GAD-like domain n=1 Tax=Actinomyces bovis TaxID=1658 RepID=A0ABY1VN43_9ACTO|nr:GAD-like domain-containing protein [Actinomyces bovis]SPT53536.1 GAD-like domain [Actinomyces bovis]VEG55493.1 GAD-like domain [Actinomyces israelii]